MCVYVCVYVDFVRHWLIPLIDSTANSPRAGGAGPARGPPSSGGVLLLLGLGGKREQKHTHTRGFLRFFCVSFCQKHCCFTSSPIRIYTPRSFFRSEFKHSNQLSEYVTGHEQVRSDRGRMKKKGTSTYIRFDRFGGRMPILPFLASTNSGSLRTYDVRTYARIIWSSTWFVFIHKAYQATFETSTIKPNTHRILLVDIAAGAAIQASLFTTAVVHIIYQVYEVYDKHHIPGIW